MLAHDTVYATVVCLEELLDQFPEYHMEPLTSEVIPGAILIPTSMDIHNDKEQE